MITKKRVLVADDQPATRNIVQFNLENSGFEVYPCANGKEALLSAREQVFDLVITDQRMPAMTGIELCCQLRELPKYKEVPIVVLSSLSISLTLEELQQMGFTAVMRKPFSPGELMSLARELTSDVLIHPNPDVIEM